MLTKYDLLVTELILTCIHALVIWNEIIRIVCFQVFIKFELFLTQVPNPSCNFNDRGLLFIEALVVTRG